jgi:hypothetical protein
LAQYGIKVSTGSKPLTSAQKVIRAEKALKTRALPEQTTDERVNLGDPEAAIDTLPEELGLVLAAEAQDTEATRSRAT